MTTITRLDVPVGTVLDYAGSATPTGYLECDGSAVSRTAYAKLFAAIGTAWGAGDGSTTFNLPNLGGRACIGRGSRSVGNTGGSETHKLTTDELPSHSHGMAHVHKTDIGHGHGNTIKATTPKLTHSVTQPAFTLPDHTHAAPGTNRFLVYNYGTVQAGVGERKVAATTSGNYAAPVVNHADVDWGAAPNTGNPGSNPACTRSTNAAVADHAATACTMSGGITDHSGTKTSGGALKSSTDSTARNSTDGSGGGPQCPSCSPTRSCGRSYASPSEVVLDDEGREGEPRRENQHGHSCERDYRGGRAALRNPVRNGRHERICANQLLGRCERCEWGNFIIHDGDDYERNHRLHAAAQHERERGDYGDVRVHRLLDARVAKAVVA